ncbi:methyltransferase domain-containing protein [Nitratireductor sp. ZSWI3]|uniref:methyltransferase domain-containing protein n=1 Tax=Nitratireductor sp. ZSWI3 TaxID=2966359 RepID=UPI00214FF835|nr:methyltransferase domain-containing protein [Nitratireductor sp. ZSWI3]MCR4265088.1 methyltransferase domain-containing protein [Nitratireductor sp. ZSWI3]
MVAVLGFTREQILNAVRDMYTDVAQQPDRVFHFPTGREACLFVGYPAPWLDALPPTAVESFAGVGFPFRADIVRPGDRVLDIGSGSGTDVLTAARLVGPEGVVFALDMTSAMLSKLRRNIERAGAGNVRVVEGNAEAIPLPDASVDVVTSNGVLNLVPDKARAFSEIFRLVRPGGSVQIADIVVGKPVSENARANPKLWAECVVGASIEEDYLEMFRAAGFENIVVLRGLDYFAASSSDDTRRVAAALGARAIEIRMSKPG